jgi:hypothetical protein
MHQFIQLLYEALILQFILLQCVFVFIYRCIRRCYLGGARSEAAMSVFARP